MPSPLPRLASTPEQARESLMTYQHVMNSSDEKLKTPLVKIMSFVHSWVCVLDETTAEPLFGPSKFVGYRDMTVQSYRDHQQHMDGRDTERVMKDWLQPVIDDDDDLYNKLYEFCARFGTKPRTTCRISVLATESQTATETNEQSDPDQAALTELLVRVIQSLPPNRRNEIARRIER
jgi:hypothetical protein